MNNERELFEFSQEIRRKDTENRYYGKDELIEKTNNAYKEREKNIIKKMDELITQSKRRDKLLMNYIEVQRELLRQFGCRLIKECREEENEEKKKTMRSEIRKISKIVCNPNYQ